MTFEPGGIHKVIFSKKESHCDVKGGGACYDTKVCIQVVQLRPRLWGHLHYWAYTLLYSSVADHNAVTGGH